MGLHSMFTQMTLSLPLAEWFYILIDMCAPLSRATGCKWWELYFIFFVGDYRLMSLLLSESLWGSFQSFSFFHHQLCGRPLDALRCFLGCPGPALHSHFLHCSLYLCLPIDLLGSHMLECQLENPSCPSARWAPQHVAKSGLVLGELLRLNPWDGRLLQLVSALHVVSSPLEAGLGLDITIVVNCSMPLDDQTSKILR